MAPTGCRDAARDATLEDASMSTMSEKGPVSMTVRVRKGEISISDRIGLEVKVEVEPGVDVTMPTFDEKDEAFSEFSVREHLREDAVEVEATGRKRWTHRYELDVFVAGEHTIPSLSASFTDRRSTADGGEPVAGTIESEPLAVKVAAIDDGEVDPTAYKDVKGPVALPVEGYWGWIRWVVAGFLATGLTVFFLLLLIRRVTKPVEAQMVPAHVVALDQLKKLADAGFIERGELAEYYYRLSMIVREYIERRFGVMAPERTTEEFLRETQGAAQLVPTHRDQLGDFLTSCDMVKYARSRPGPEDIEQALTFARVFIEQTADRGSEPLERAAA
jgi:hypothetical protein